MIKIEIEIEKGRKIMMTSEVIIRNLYLLSIKNIFIYLLIWLCWVGLSCSMWDFSCDT